MRLVFLIALFVFPRLAGAQSQAFLKVYAVTLAPGRGQVLYASNEAYCPVSVKIDFSMENMQFSKGDQDIFVIPARTDSFKIGEVTPAELNRKYRYSYRTRYCYGDVTRKNYDKDHAYLLPYEKGKNFFVNQGYYGNFSHRDVQAIDFTMPEGTPILAAREGIVIKVVQHNSAGCSDESCKDYNNEVLIYQPDGTIAVYAHIKQNGAKVKPGDPVKSGDVIALSGNTGWSSGPHLHFACYLFDIADRKTVATYFKTGDGSTTALLKEKQWYAKGY